ncbi:MAG: aerotolerance regulator BatA [Candidatus Omnitrophica bacterium CG1_02_49_10]|nr:MAG: aerotolerance regulator BatA [Candidatus Omnitrophica bacterium CG1_02_49_10]
MYIHNKPALLLLFLVPLLVYLYTAGRRKREPALRFSALGLFKGTSVKGAEASGLIPMILRIAAIVFLILALSRPQEPLEGSRIRVEGVDIVLAIDVSTSMLAEDFAIGRMRRNRLDVVKTVVEEFIGERENDRIGLVAFAGRPYTVAPLTFDHDWLLKNMERVEIGMVEDATAIGSAIASSLNRLKSSDAKSKVLILLTDGRNNAGSISPNTAAEAAKALNVKIYAIGAGTKGEAPYPGTDIFGNRVYRPVKIEIDDEALTKISEITGGRYFRAEDTESLKEIFAEIDKLEKTKLEAKHYAQYNELFANFVLCGFIFFVLELILSNTALRRLP